MLEPRAGRVVGRYVVHDEIASGGMATVHLGRLLGSGGFARTVAVKCLHPAATREPEFVSMLLDEGHLASRVRHPNVVQTLDVVSADGDLFLVMEYVHGESLARLLAACRARGEKIPFPAISAVVGGMLFGLHAAHEATSDTGEPLGIVHRDVSPQNLLVGADGVPRILDFGVAKAASRLQSTTEGQVKGKLRYMAPEQLRQRPVDRRTDVFAAGVVLCEALSGRRLFDGPDAGAIVTQILMGEIARAPDFGRAVPDALAAIAHKSLATDPADRFATAREMAIALERAVAPATAREVGEWVESVAGEALAERAALVAAIERGAREAKTDVAARADEATAPAPLADVAAPASGAATRAPDETGTATLPWVAPAPGAVESVAPGASTDAGAPRTTEATPAKRSWRSLGIAAVVLAAGTTAWIVTSSRSGDGDRSASAGAEAGRAGVAAAPVGATASPTASDAPKAIADGSTAPAPAPTESAAAGAPDASASASAATTARAPSGKPGAAGARKPRMDCDPPFVVKDGIKQFKPQCL